MVRFSLVLFSVLLTSSLFSAESSTGLDQKKIRVMMRYFPVIKNLEDNQRFLGETKKSLERQTVEILQTVHQISEESSSTDEAKPSRRDLQRRRSVHIRRDSSASELVEHRKRSIYSGTVFKMGDHGRWSKRHLIITADELVFYQNEKHAGHQRRVPLDGLGFRKVRTNKRDHCLELERDELRQRFVFQLSSSEEQEQWVSALRGQGVQDHDIDENDLSDNEIIEVEEESDDEDTEARRYVLRTLKTYLEEQKKRIQEIFAVHECMRTSVQYELDHLE